MVSEDTVTCDDYGGHNGTCYGDVISEDDVNKELITCHSHVVIESKTPGGETKAVPLLCSQRWILAYLGFYFGFVVHVLRVNMSLTLPYMVKTNVANVTFDHVVNTSSLVYVHVDLNQSVENECSGTLQASDVNKDAEFTWSKFVQSLILAGYFWGYVVPQIAGGWVAGRYGGKRVITCGMTVKTLLTLLTPVLARASPYALIAARFIIGFCAGASFPALFNLLGSWSLPTERSRMVAMVFGGSGLGTIVGILTSGVLSEKGFDNGWGSVFYVHGIFSALFVVLWVMCAADTPQQHPRISESERAMFESQRKTNAQDKRVSTPWRAMLTYVPLWVVCFTHSVQNFTLYLLFLCLPLYLKDVMHFNIQNNGLFSSLPFLTNSIGVVIAGLLADCLVARKFLSTSAIRKLFECTGLLGMAGMLVIPGFLTCNQAVPVILCLSASTLFEALGQTAGYGSNIVDLAPRHASMVFGISNTFATIPGMIAPIMVAELTPQGTVEEWRVVFYIAAICSVIGAVVFGLFSSSELAPWAEERSIEITVAMDQTKKPFHSVIELKTDQFDRGKVP